MIVQVLSPLVRMIPLCWAVSTISASWAVASSGVRPPMSVAGDADPGVHLVVVQGGVD